jgi:hypothetical protein
MRLRPEQLALLGVLGVGVGILLLQIGQDWSLPDLGPAPPAPGEPAPAGPAGGPAADAPESGAPRPQVALGLRIDPVAPRLEDPLTLIAGLGGAERVQEVSFALLYDPSILGLSAGAHGPMGALADAAGEPPEMSLSAPQPGRLEIRLRRRGGDPSLNAAGDLCAVQFSVLKRGAARVQIDHASVRENGGESVAAAGAELSFEVR